MSTYRIVQTGDSRSFPAPHPLLEQADAQGASRVFIGDRAGWSFFQGALVVLDRSFFVAVQSVSLPEIEEKIWQWQQLVGLIVLLDGLLVGTRFVEGSTGAKVCLRSADLGVVDGDRLTIADVRRAVVRCPGQIDHDAGQIVRVAQILVAYAGRAISD